MQQNNLVYNQGPYERVAFITMGCAKNEVDTNTMTRALQGAGYVVTNDVNACDAVIVNTCSFIQAATEESIEAVLDAVALGSQVKVIVSGCMPARYGQDLQDELPEVAQFVPCAEESQIVQVVDKLFARQRSGIPQSVPQDPGVQPLVSAYVKISDGCDRFCSYCTIPFIRGRYHSFTLDSIRAEVAREVQQGAKEIVLIAQDTGRWGEDCQPVLSLAYLLDTLAREFSAVWFRVMYIQPEGISDQLIDVIAEHDNICSYLDIPFQHSNERILASMNRTGSYEQNLSLVHKLRQRIPGVTLRTTLIAGFPGETEGDFEELCSFVEEAELDYVGVFPFSREEGTRSYHLEGQLPDDEKQYRAQRLRDIADAVSSGVIAQRRGQTLPVLVCGHEEDGQVFGRAMCQAPDVDGVTFLNEGLPGEVLDVHIEDTLMYEMEGEVVA